MNKNISPVGWYIGTYLIRFTEIDDPINDDPESRFDSWANTVIVKSKSLKGAFKKIEKIGLDHTKPYKGGPEGVPVKWEYVGIIEVLPIYEELEDGSEVMWAEHGKRKLKNLESMVGEFDQFVQ